VRATIFKLLWSFSIALLAFGFAGAAQAAGVSHHDAVVVVSSDAVHADGMDGGCNGPGQTKGQTKQSCCDPCHCNPCLADAPIMRESVIRTIIRTASLAIPYGISIRPPRSPPRVRV
jgi:hypothetical protein